MLHGGLGLRIADAAPTSFAALSPVPTTRQLKAALLLARPVTPVHPIPKREPDMRDVPFEAPITRVRRAVDLMIALLTFPLWGTLLLLLIAAIKCEDWRQPALLRQYRIGYMGYTFTVLKLRTWKRPGRVGEEPVSEKGDPRISRVGAFLRETYLDELPQLFNVIAGDMTLIGPRPVPLETHALRVQLLGDTYYGRYMVTPGLTGLGQLIREEDKRLDGRGLRKRLTRDRGLIRWRNSRSVKSTMLFDAKIFFATIRAVITRRGM